MMVGRAAFGTPDRIRALMSAWCGGPLRPREIADLIGVPRGHDALHQAIHRAVDEGVLIKAGRGLYASASRLRDTLEGGME